MSSMCVAWCKSDLTNYNRNLVCSKSNKEQPEQPLPELLSRVLSKDPKNGRGLVVTLITLKSFIRFRR